MPITGEMLIGATALRGADKPIRAVDAATGEPLDPAFVPWLMLNRLGLTVLVHPNTEDARADHLVHALWMGEVLPLNADVLPAGPQA